MKSFLINLFITLKYRMDSLNRYITRFMLVHNFIPLLISLFAISILSAATYNQRSLDDMVAIYEQYRAYDNDMFKVVLSNEQLFEDCMKTRKVAFTINIYHKAFIMKQVLCPVA